MVSFGSAEGDGRWDGADRWMSAGEEPELEGWWRGPSMGGDRVRGVVEEGGVPSDGGRSKRNSKREEGEGDWVYVVDLTSLNVGGWGARTGVAGQMLMMENRLDARLLIQDTALRREVCATSESARRGRNVAAGRRAGLDGRSVPASPTLGGVQTAGRGCSRPGRWVGCDRLAWDLSTPPRS